MNKSPSGPWMFRWGKKAFMKTLGRNLPGASMIPPRLFRRAPIIGPVLAWIAGIAIHDLRQPDSRIRDFARRALVKLREPRHVKTIVVTPAVIEGPEGQGDRDGPDGQKLKKG